MQMQMPQQYGAAPQQMMQPQQYGAAPGQQFAPQVQYAPQVQGPQVQYGAPAPQAQPQMQYAAPPQQAQYAPQPQYAPQQQMQYAPPLQTQYAPQQFAAAPAQPVAVGPQMGATYAQNPEGAEMLQVTVFGTKQLSGSQQPTVEIEIAGKPHKHTIESASIEGPNMTPKSLITYYLPGEHLNFTVTEGGQLLGDVQISGQDFHPNGLEGDLPLMDPNTGAQGSGYLMVRIVPLGNTGQAVELPPVEIKGERTMQMPEQPPQVVGQSAMRAISPEEFEQLGAQGAQLVTADALTQPVMAQPQPSMPQYAPQPQPMMTQAQPQPMYAQPQPQPQFYQQQPQAMPMQTQQMPMQQGQPMYGQPQMQQGFSMPFPGSAAQPRY